MLQQTREARQLLPSQGAARRLCSGTLALFKAHARAASDGGTAACGVRRCRARRPEPGRHHRWRAPRCSSPCLRPLVAPIPVDMIPRSLVYFSWCLPWSDELTAPPCEPPRWCSSEQTKQIEQRRRTLQSRSRGKSRRAALLIFFRLSVSPRWSTAGWAPRPSSCRWAVFESIVPQGDVGANAERYHCA